MRNRVILFIFFAVVAFAGFFVMERLTFNYLSEQKQGEGGVQPSTT